LKIVRMNASVLMYPPRTDRNAALHARIVGMALRHRRYGVRVIHLKLRQQGAPTNDKRGERPYRLEQLHIRRHRRKKILQSTGSEIENLRLWRYETSGEEDKAGNVPIGFIPEERSWRDPYWCEYRTRK
jgi:hypothetical protein